MPTEDKTSADIVKRLKYQRKCRQAQPEKPAQILGSLHRKSYFKTSQEIALNFGTMAAPKDRQFIDDYYAVAINLQRRASKNQALDEQELVNFLQKKYGQNVEFDSLTQDVLKTANFVRSPPPAKQSHFLRQHAGKGGWGKRSEGARVPGQAKQKRANFEGSQARRAEQ